MFYIILVDASNTSEIRTYSNPELQQQMDDSNDWIELHRVHSNQMFFKFN
jgi:hypothetical protein